MTLVVVCAGLLLLGPILWHLISSPDCYWGCRSISFALSEWAVAAAPLTIFALLLAVKLDDPSDDGRLLYWHCALPLMAWLFVGAVLCAKESNNWWRWYICPRSVGCTCGPLEPEVPAVRL